MRAGLTALLVALCIAFVVFRASKPAEMLTVEKPLAGMGFVMGPSYTSGCGCVRGHSSLRNSLTFRALRATRPRTATELAAADRVARYSCRILRASDSSRVFTRRKASQDWNLALDAGKISQLVTI